MPVHPPATIAPTPTVAAPPLAPSGAGALPRRLGLFATAAFVVGNIIGSGIFRVPSAVAADAGSVGAALAVWILGGVVTTCGALAMAELAAMLPRSGGLYVYLREAFGPAAAFVFGWTALFLTPAGTAGVALVFAQYVGTLVPLGALGERAVAAAAVSVLGIAAYRSTRGGAAIQGAATLAKLLGIVVLVALAFALGDGRAGAFGAGAPPAGTPAGGGILLALVAALWSFNGFQDMLNVAGEVRDPGRALPRALVLGMAAVVLVYLAANLAYLWVLPFAELRASPVVASAMAARVLGSAGAALVSALVIVSTFGTLNGIVVTMPRFFYAMAADGLLFAPLARVHPRFGTPHVAILAYTLCALLLVWFRSFEQLSAAFVLGLWPFSAAAAAAVLVLRRTRPDLPRPYRTPGYPFVPLVFVAGVALVLGNAILERPASTLLGIVLTLLGVPVYVVWRRVSR